MTVIVKATKLNSTLGYRENRRDLSISLSLFPFREGLNLPKSDFRDGSGLTYVYFIFFRHAFASQWG